MTQPVTKILFLVASFLNFTLANFLSVDLNRLDKNYYIPKILLLKIKNILLNPY